MFAGVVEEEEDSHDSQVSVMSLSVSLSQPDEAGLVLISSSPF